MLGVKHDSGKPRWDLAPMKEFEECVKVLTFGAEKYEDNGWKNVSPERYVAAMLRHITQYMSGENLDSESGLHHLAHVQCNAVFLLWFYNFYLGEEELH